MLEKVVELELRRPCVVPYHLVDFTLNNNSPLRENRVGREAAVRVGRPSADKGYGHGRCLTKSFECLLLRMVPDATASHLSL